jgi:hypothetical protein
MNQLTLHNLYDERIEEIETIINIESNDDDDLKQEGLLGAYQALKIDPHANKRFMMNKGYHEDSHENALLDVLSNRRFYNMLIY